MLYLSLAQRLKTLYYCCRCATALPLYCYATAAAATAVPIILVPMQVHPLLLLPTSLLLPLQLQALLLQEHSYYRCSCCKHYGIGTATCSTAFACVTFKLSLATLFYAVYMCAIASRLHSNFVAHAVTIPRSSSGTHTPKRREGGLHLDLTIFITRKSNFCETNHSLANTPSSASLLFPSAEPLSSASPSFLSPRQRPSRQRARVIIDQRGFRTLAETLGEFDASLSASLQ
jgi:hypothetical protein